MKEFGKLGGSKRPQTQLRKAAAVDDGLREQAREVLAKALRGEDVPKAALDSAPLIVQLPLGCAASRRSHGRWPAAAEDRLDRRFLTVAIEAGIVEARDGTIFVAGQSLEVEPPARVGRGEASTA